MSDCTDYWHPMMGAFAAIIGSLPQETRDEICERLQLTAVAQADKGLMTASYFSRMLSGEPAPVMSRKPELRVV
jgi:hypothetical protein